MVVLVQAVQNGIRVLPPIFAASATQSIFMETSSQKLLVSSKVLEKYTKVAPVEFVFVPVFDYMHKDSSSLAQLADGIEAMFDHVRAVNVILQVLETPKISVHSIYLKDLFQPADFSRLLRVLRHAPLRELMLFFGTSSTVEGPPTAGLSGLEKLSYTGICQRELGSSSTHLYDLI